MNKSISFGFGTFCILIGIFIIFSFPTSYFTGIFGSAFCGLGISFLVIGMEKQ